MLRRRLVYCILLICFTIFLFIGFGYFRNNILPEVNFKMRIKIAGSLDIDFFGAIVPLIVSFLIIIILFSVQKFSWKKYSQFLMLAIAISLMFSTAVTNAIIVNYQLIGLFIGIVSFMLSFYEGNFRDLFREESTRHFYFCFQNYITSVLIGYSLGSLASLMTDIMWLPLASFLMYIGGAGLEDGIFLIGLYSALISVLLGLWMKGLFSTKCWKKHSIRRGRKDDTPISFVVGKNRTPSYVLMCNNQQVGAMDGNPGLIAFLEVFKPHRGVKHSEIFLGLLEREAKSQGITRIEMATPTIEPKFIAALKRCKFDLVEEEPDGNCWFAKDL